jgi:hypothetical protein
MMARMAVGACSNCSEPLKAAAKFCPKCGRPAPAGGARPAEDEAARRARVARREVILGWILLALASVLVVPVVFGRGGGIRGWLGLGLGVVLAFIALGCLVGDAPKKGQGASKSK